MKKAIVLSSGGIDSTTCVGIAVKDVGSVNVSTVSIFYGQKHSKELKSAEQVAQHYDVKHYVLDLSKIMEFSNCPLLERSTEEIKHKSYAQQIAEDGEGMVSTYVPFRNGLLLSAAAAVAMSLNLDGETDIYLGNHADDAAGSAYADCSFEFIFAMNEAIRLGTYGKVTIQSPLVDLNKAEVVEWGLALDVPYHLTWSCYEGGEAACGTCGTCIDRLNAFRTNCATDPIVYKVVEGSNT